MSDLKFFFLVCFNHRGMHEEDLQIHSNRPRRLMSVDYVIRFPSPNPNACKCFGK